MNPIYRSRTIREICNALNLFAIGWLLAAIWFNPPLENWEGIVVLILLAINFILRRIE